MINFNFLLRSAFLWYLFCSTFHVWPPAVKWPSPPPTHLGVCCIIRFYLCLKVTSQPQSYQLSLSLCQSSYLITSLLTCRCWPAAIPTLRSWLDAVDLSRLSRRCRSTAVHPPLLTRRCWPTTVDLPPPLTADSAGPAVAVRVWSYYLVWLWSCWTRCGWRRRTLS
jgi:hypothetical protein